MMSVAAEPPTRNSIIGLMTLRCVMVIASLHDEGPMLFNVWSSKIMEKKDDNVYLSVDG